MKRYTINELKAEYKRLGYIFPEFHIFAIRSKENLPNKFDDLLGFVYKDQIFYGTGTTNPGTYWLNNPSRVEGTALLKEGQYIDSWTIGKHQGKYDALVQAKPVTVYRDNDKDNIAEETAKTETGFFGINWHRANENATSQNVDKWSAGCQVFNNPNEFNTFLKACSESGKGVFTATILKEF